MTRTLSLTVLYAMFASPLAAQDPWVVYKGEAGPGKGKKVVLVSGDEEYRSEEMLPQLGKILAKRHGFDCTVLFAIGKDGTINPERQKKQIPGLEALKDADLWSSSRASANCRMSRCDTSPTTSSRASRS